MGKKPLPENASVSCGAPCDVPEPSQQQSLTQIDPGYVCKECLNEDFDTCVCPEPEK